MRVLESRGHPGEKTESERVTVGSMNMKQYNIVDLFAGVGGLTYGFSELPQFHIVAANEIENDIAIAYTLNHPKVKMLNCDIGELTEGILKDTLKGLSAFRLLCFRCNS